MGGGSPGPTAGGLFVGLTDGRSAEVSPGDRSGRFKLKPESIVQSKRFSQALRNLRHKTEVTDY